MNVSWSVSSDEHRRAMIRVSSAQMCQLHLQREVAGLNIPVFDQEMDARRPPDSTQVGETESKVQLDSVRGAKMATSFLHSEGLPPIPANLVAKIQKGDFVDVAELLRDNMEAERRHSKEDGASTSSGQLAQSRREVPNMLSWVQFFGIYTSIVVQTCLEKTQQLLAYQAMLLREARRCGGTGW